MFHRLMRHVGYENVLYCDTDSCIFKLKTDEKVLKDKIILEDGKEILLQSHLGGLTDEVEDYNGMIEKLVAQAPKTYGYK